MPIGIRVIDDWSKMILLWTFEYPKLSGIIIVGPIVFWVVLGLIYLITNSDYYGESKQRIFSSISVYVLTPIVYFYFVGYFGYLILG